MRPLPIAVCASVVAFAQAPPAPSRHVAAPIVDREQKTVLVHGRPETWRLEWHGAPRPYCPASEAIGSLTCPCDGFAYGEAGDLWLVRVDRGEEIDSLDLSPLFEDPLAGDSGKAIVQRWAPDYDHDFDLLEQPDFLQRVSGRPVVTVMHFADYDHDGAATEFYIQAYTLACGHHGGVVVGVSARNPSLHAFGPAAAPDRPLYLEPDQWEAFRRATTSPVHLVAWPCGDHAASTQTELLLRWSAAGIDGTESEYTCPPAGSARRLLSRRPLGER